MISGKLLFTILCLLSTFALADDGYQNFAYEALHQAPSQIKAYKQDAEDAMKVSNSLTTQYHQDAKQAKQHELSFINSTTLTSEGSDSLSQLKTQTHKALPQIIVFVSFSMPDQSLQSILRDAKKAHASVVIRGLIHNSFQETFKRVAHLVDASGGNGLELNPLLFTRFNINTVPAVVVMPSDSACGMKDACTNQAFDIVKGDITLEYALKMVRDRGEIANLAASDALSLMKDNQYEN